MVTVAVLLYMADEDTQNKIWDGRFLTLGEVDKSRSKLVRKAPLGGTSAYCNLPELVTVAVLLYMADEDTQNKIWDGRFLTLGEVDKSRSKFFRFKHVDDHELLYLGLKLWVCCEKC